MWTMPDGEGSFSFGRATDLPLCGDFDGDGDAEPAVKRGNRYSLASGALDGGGGVTSFVFGRGSDQPLVGEWDGDGVDEIAVRRGGVTHFAEGAVDGGGAVVSTVFGRATDQVVAVRGLSTQEHDSLAARRGRTVYVSEDRVDGPVTADYDFTLGRPGDLAITPGDGLVGVLRPAL